MKGDSPVPSCWTLFPEESDPPPCSDAQSRPASGKCVLSRSRGLRSLQKKFRRKVLMATVQAHRPPVSPDDLLKALRYKHGIRRGEVLVEVCAPPADFFVRFESARACKRVLESSVVVRCNGAPVTFARWQPAGCGVEPSCEHPFLAKMSFDGLPRDAWNQESLNELLISMGGCLLSMTPPSDSWSVEVMAWMREWSSSRIPKVIVVEVPMLKPKHTGVHHSAPPRFCQHKVTVHVKEVTLNHQPACAPIMEGKDLVSYHVYDTWVGRVDGTGPPPFRDGGHFFVGSNGRAGGLKLD